MTVQPDVYVVFGKVEHPVMPTVSLLGSSRYGARRHAQDPANKVIEIDDSPSVVAIAYQLLQWRKGKHDLVGAQPYVMNKIVAPDHMAKVLNYMFNGVFHRYQIWAEPVDTEPHSRNPDLRLPNGKNAFMYRRSWSVNGAAISVNGMNEENLIPVRLPDRDGEMDDEWLELTDLKNTDMPGYHYPTILERSRSRGGVNASYWEFWLNLAELTTNADMDTEIRNRGVLLASQLTIEQLLEQL